MSIGFIIQARLGSTRLPEKILKPFNGSKNILEIIIENLLEKFPSQKIIIATTTNKNDDRIEKLTKAFNLPCYRGSESNVLNRFINAAREHNLDVIYRVCSDNPLIDVDSFLELEKCFHKENFDYVGFSCNGTPSIKTHFGFWGELVKRIALEKVESLTDETLYHEHVTNFIYANPQIFKLGWVDVDPLIGKRSDVRFTVDTIEDFNLLKDIYAYFQNHKITKIPMNVIKYIDENPHIKEYMKTQILRNSK